MKQLPSGPPELECCCAVPIARDASGSTQLQTGKRETRGRNTLRMKHTKHMPVYAFETFNDSVPTKNWGRFLEEHETHACVCS
jgi:hypothetical protein